MDISYFKEFRVLAEICNYQEAAEQLYMSLSTLSKHISRLESELGTALFDRTTRKVSLNKYGEIFYEYAVMATDSYDSCTLRLKELQQDETASLRIAFPPTLTEYRLPSLLTAFTYSHPDMKVVIHEHDNPQQLLKDNLCDIAFCTEYGQISESASSFCLPLDTLVAVLPANHPLAKEKYLTMDQLREERFIIKSDPSAELSVIFHRICSNAGFKPKTICSVRYSSAMPKMVNTCQGVAITNKRHAAISDTPYLAIAELRPAVHYYVYILCSDSADHAAASQCFLNYCSTHRKDLALPDCPVGNDC